MCIRITSYILVFYGIFSCNLYEDENSKKNKSSKKLLSYEACKKYTLIREMSISSKKEYATLSFPNEKIIFHNLRYHNFESWDIFFSLRMIGLNDKVSVAFLDNVDFYEVEPSHIKEACFKNSLLESQIFYEKITVFQSYSFVDWILGGATRFRKEIVPRNRVFIFKLPKHRYVKFRVLDYNSGVYKIQWAFILIPLKKSKKNNKGAPKVQNS